MMFSVVLALLCLNGVWAGPALKCDVGIVGGGLSGLYMAYEIKNDIPTSIVCIFEKDDTVGGRIRDHRFDLAPEIDVGLGAWRVDKNQAIMLDLLDELKLPYHEWSFVKPNLYESRAIATNNTKDIKVAYPSLLSHPVFGNMSSGEMWDYLLRPEIRAQSSQYSTIFSFLSNVLTSEGANYLADLSGYKGELKEFINPDSFMEYLEIENSLSHTFVRPDDGMSSIINKLHKEITAKGVKLFTSEPVLAIGKRRSKYVLRSRRRIVVADKLVVAVPPKPFREIKGKIARKLQKAKQFDSIQPIPAFKGGAIYHTAWWENVKIGGSTVQAGQKYISQDNCLGITVAHRGYGLNGTAVMHTVYTDGACAERWRDVAELKKNYIDFEIRKALEAKYEVKVPKPIATEYQFWESAWHYQKPDTPFTMKDIENWAKRPNIHENVFFVGEAYHPFRGWCEGVIVSCRNALKEGWGIKRNVKNYAKRWSFMKLGKTLDAPAGRG